MPDVKFDIQLSTDSVNSRVLCNGEDISRYVHSVTVKQVAKQRPIITIEVRVGAVIAEYSDAKVSVRLRPEPETRDAQVET